MPYVLVKVSGSHTRVWHSNGHLPQENASLNKAVKLQQLNEYLIIIYDNCPVSSKQASFRLSLSFRLLSRLLWTPAVPSVCVQSVHSVLLCMSVCVCVCAKLNVLQVLLLLLQVGSVSG